MPEFIISGRIPGYDEDSTSIIVAETEAEAQDKFATEMYEFEPAREESVRERFMEWEADERAIYITSVTTSWESDLLSKCREVIKAYDARGYGIGEEMVELAELLEKIERKENDGPDVEQNSEG